MAGAIDILVGDESNHPDLRTHGIRSVINIPAESGETPYHIGYVVASLGDYHHSGRKDYLIEEGRDRAWTQMLGHNFANPAKPLPAQEIKGHLPLTLAIKLDLGDRVIRTIDQFEETITESVEAARARLLGDDESGARDRIGGYAAAYILGVGLALEPWNGDLKDKMYAAATKLGIPEDIALGLTISAKKTFGGLVRIER